MDKIHFPVKTESGHGSYIAAFLVVGSSMFVFILFCAYFHHTGEVCITAPEEVFMDPDMFEPISEYCSLIEPASNEISEEYASFEWYQNAVNMDLPASWKLETCTDNPSYIDPLERGCDWYATRACRDGNTVMETNTNVDEAGNPTQDSYGDGCGYYANNPNNCGTGDDDDFVSSEMCLGCGGGEINEFLDDVLAACPSACHAPGCDRYVDPAYFNVDLDLRIPKTNSWDKFTENTPVRITIHSPLRFISVTGAAVDTIYMESNNMCLWYQPTCRSFLNRLSDSVDEYPASKIPKNVRSFYNYYPNMDGFNITFDSTSSDEYVDVRMVCLAMEDFNYRFEVTRCHFPSHLDVVSSALPLSQLCFVISGLMAFKIGNLIMGTPPEDKPEEIELE